MASPIARVVRRTVRNTVRTGQKMMSQIVVSVAAAVCVGLITNAYLTEKPVSSATDVTVSDEQTADVAIRPVRVIEGATYTTVRSGSPERSLGPPPEMTVRDTADIPQDAADIQQHAAAEVPQTAVPEPDQVEAARLPPLSSEMIADLPIHDTSADDAEIFPGVPAESTLAASIDQPVAGTPATPERRRFLGLPIPRFVPTANQLVQSASAAGGKIVSIIER